ncbi:MAG: hypothetical protein Tsb0013_14080 [Phycisphaerales bacterium]
MSPIHLISGAAVALCCATASATPIFDVFGPLPQATFGGTGIPNDEVAAGSQFVDGTNTITIALSATQRFSNPPLTNDGAGTYFAGPGSNFGGMGESSTEGALWNFNFYMEAVDGSNNPIALSNYQIDLYYDFDPAPNTALGDLGRIDVTAGLLAQMDTTNVTQGSQNLNFGFLAAGFPGLVFPPAGTFDPNALGEYTFALTLSEIGGLGLPLETVSILVEVVPSAPTLAMLGPVGLLAMRRRRA